MLIYVFIRRSNYVCVHSYFQLAAGGVICRRIAVQQCTVGSVSTCPSSASPGYPTGIFGWSAQEAAGLQWRQGIQTLRNQACIENINTDY